MALTLDIAGDIRAAVASLVPDLREAVVKAVQAAMRDRLVDIEEAAEIAGCSPGALRKRIARGTLPVVRCGRTVRVRTSDLLGEVRP
jgi:excisionase family DNA binding protein